jgi:hypothetical protein
VIAGVATTLFVRSDDQSFQVNHFSADPIIIEVKLTIVSVFIRASHHYDNEHIFCGSFVTHGAVIGSDKPNKATRELVDQRDALLTTTVFLGILYPTDSRTHYRNSMYICMQHFRYPTKRKSA